MTNSSFRVASSLILLLITWSGFGFSDAQAAPAEDRQIVMEKVEMDVVKPEKLGASRGAGASGQGKWILVEFAYEVKPDLASKEKSTHLDEVQFKVSVEGSEGERANKTVILSGEVTYMVVPIGKGFGAMFIPADVAALYHLDKYMSKYNVNVQAFVGGQLVDSKDKKTDDENWFSRPDYKAISGMLLNKQQSPFVLNDTDRYPTIKPKQGN